MKLSNRTVILVVNSVEYSQFRIVNAPDNSKLMSEYNRYSTACYKLILN